ncbi:hypothetical protein [Undibacterium sp. TJN19]|uniref:hypothetical protein n=1 Tax=Undibacterium sp. TJN19 TaxID=3413055 RepID=UPI003BF3ACFB
MFEKIGLFYNVFRQGQAVTDAAKLKNKQVLANTLAVLLTTAYAIGKNYGYDFHLSDEDLTHIAAVAAVVFGLFNVGATTASTDKIGLLPARQSLAEQQQAMSDVAAVEPAKPLFFQPGSAMADSDNPLAGLDTTYRP